VKKLFKYLHGYKNESVLGPLLKLAEATLELIVPLIIAAIVDNGIPSENKGYVVKMCLLLVALGLVGLAFSVTAQYFSAKASVGFVSGIRLALFEKTLAAMLETNGPVSFLSEEPYADWQIFVDMPLE